MKFAFQCLTVILTILWGRNMAIPAKNLPVQKTESTTEAAFLTTVTPRTHAKNVQNQTTADNNVTDIPKNDFTDNGSLLINVTLSEFDNSTDENDNEAHDIHSSFNLAIIPAVAVFVFIIVSCIKCCKWFRQYTRGDNKDEHYYAVIVTDDDKDYGQIDILSEAASTACYDTVSSYTSFLKRSGNDSTLNSIRTLRQEPSKHDQSMTSQTGNNNNMGRTTRTEEKKNASNNNTDSKSLNSGSTIRKDATQGIYDVRTSSTSSTETVSEHLTDSPAIRRNNRFRVSFVTEKRKSKPSTFENKFPNNNARNEKIIRSSLKKPSTRDVKLQNTASQNSSSKNGESVAMIHVGTQTNKSFRYSLRKSKGHVSDSDIDERILSKLNSNVSTLQTEEGQSLHDNVVTKNSNKHINAVMYTKHSSLSQEEHSEPLNASFMAEISKYPFDTNVEVIHNCNPAKEVDEEIEDDVFVKEDIKAGTPTADKESNTVVNKLSKSFNDTETKNQENLKESFSGNDVAFCVNCNLKTSQNKYDVICDKVQTQVAKNETIIQKYCEKCEFLHKDKHKDLCSKDNKETEAFLIENQCKFTLGEPPECNGRPSSSLSLESSGYAELSSSDSSSSTH